MSSKLMKQFLNEINNQLALNKRKNQQSLKKSNKQQSVSRNNNNQQRCNKSNKQYCVNKSNKQFIDKMTNYYQKKNSHTSMSSYKKQKHSNNYQNKNNDVNNEELGENLIKRGLSLNKQVKKQLMLSQKNPIKQQLLIQQRKWANIQGQLNRIIEPFNKQLINMMKNINQQNKFYKLLSIIRKNELLSDISQEVNNKLIKDNFMMKKQIQSLKLSINHLNKTNHQLEIITTKHNYNNSINNASNNNSPHNNKQFNNNLANSNHINHNSPSTMPMKKLQKLDSTRSIPQNIYIQSKLMKQVDFIEWCDRILMKNKVTITNLNRQMISFPKKQYNMSYDRLNKNKNILFQQKTNNIITNNNKQILKSHNNINPIQHKRSLSAVYEKNNQANNVEFNNKKQQYNQQDNMRLVQRFDNIYNKIRQLSILTQKNIFQSIKLNILNDLQLIKGYKLNCNKYCCSLQNINYHLLLSQSLNNYQQQLLPSKSLLNSHKKNNSVNINNKSLNINNKRHNINNMSHNNNKSFDNVNNNNKQFNNVNNTHQNNVNNNNSPQRDIYRDNKMQQYFSRYYNSDGFKMKQIRSVQHSKAQQMQKLQHQYFKMLEHRSKLRYGY